MKSLFKLFFAGLFCYSVSAMAITFDGFDDTSKLVLNGATTTEITEDGTVLRVTPAISSQSGSAFSKATVNAAKFSTFFKFRITEKGGSIFDCNSTDGADGLVFVVQSIASDIGGAGQGIGYEGIEQSVGVEFDTWCNAGNNDPSSNHVAIVRDGVVDHDAVLPVKDIPTPFDDGKIWYVWIDYDGMNLEVRFNQTGVRPDSPEIETDIDIPAILGDVSDAYVGFTSGTGADWGNHDVLYWEYRRNYRPVETLSGIVNRLEKIRVTCKNVTTGQSVKIPVSNTKDWNCEDAGLVGTRGQKARIIIKGTFK